MRRGPGWGCKYVNTEERGDGRKERRTPRMRMRKRRLRVVRRRVWWMNTAVVIVIAVSRYWAKEGYFWARL